jgi:RNA recognition motif-containing protein
MNLYIKNLEPNITNQDLSQAFRRFGRIISARVMTNPATGQSKGYGFVSFGRPEEAAAALYEMNGFLLNNRPLIVNYHEPKKGSRNRQDITPPSFYDNRSHVDMRSVNGNIKKAIHIYILYIKPGYSKSSASIHVTTSFTA